MTRIGTSDLNVFPLSLGGNVFGWTADRDASFAVLDAFVGRRRRLHRHRRRVQCLGPGQLGWRERDDHRRVARLAQAAERRRRDQGQPAPGLQGTRGRERPQGSRSLARPTRRRHDRPLLRALRRRDGSAGGDRRRLRTARDRWPRAQRRRLELQRRAHPRVDRDRASARASPCRSRCSRTTTSCTATRSRRRSSRSQRSSISGSCRITRSRADS